MKVIQFLRYRYLAYSISFVAIVACLALTWLQGGFNLGLDFQAGARIQVKIDLSVKAPIETVRSALGTLDNPQIQTIGNASNQEYAIKVKQIGESKTFSTEVEGKIRTALGQRFGEGKVQILQTEYVGPRFSSDLASQALFLTLFALLLIMLYAWFRFKLAYALAAIAATIHDPLFMIGFIGATQMEVSTATVAAVLTIIGYSINDTIVVFDRIRENVRLMRETPFPVIINTSITQSLSRTIITSLTTIIAILAVYIFGSGDVRYFALNVIVGIVVGTYSSIFIASPILLELKNLGEKWRLRREKGKIPVKKEVKQAPAPQEEASEETGASQDRESEERRDTKPSVTNLELVEGEAVSKPSSVPTSVSVSSKVAFTPRLSREKRKRKGKK
ncbi:MAG: protein translocase subunit SecF [Spirochaetes bacterium]|nr:protein translocase subunit SecF [Spirochaetota bacterium]